MTVKENNYYIEIEGYIRKNEINKKSRINRQTREN